MILGIQLTNVSIALSVMPVRRSSRTRGALRLLGIHAASPKGERSPFHSLSKSGLRHSGVDEFIYALDRQALVDNVIYRFQEPKFVFCSSAEV